MRIEEFIKEIEAARLRSPYKDAADVYIDGPYKLRGGDAELEPKTVHVAPSGDIVVHAVRV